MKVKLSSATRAHLATLLHRVRSETIHAARAELLEDFENTPTGPPEYQRAKSREDRALSAFFAFLYEPVDVEPPPKPPPPKRRRRRRA